MISWSTLASSYVFAMYLKVNINTMRVNNVVFFFFFWEGGVNGELDDDLDLVKEFPKGRERGTREGEIRILIHGNVAFLTPNGTINIVYMLVFHSTTNYK